MLRSQPLLAACISIARSHHRRSAVRMCPRSQVMVLCGAAGVDDDWYSLEAQGREKRRKVESGRLPQFRIPVQTGAVARSLRAERCQRTVYSRKGAHLCTTYAVHCVPVQGHAAWS